MTFTYLFSQVKYFITWFRKFTLCKASKNATNCVETETPKWTWDMWQKDFDPSLHKNMSPFWWTKKRGLFLPPSLPYGPMSPSQQFFFFECIPKPDTWCKKRIEIIISIFFLKQVSKFLSIQYEMLISYDTDKGRVQKKKTEKSDIVQKGRVGWTPKTYF